MRYKIRIQEQEEKEIWLDLDEVEYKVWEETVLSEYKKGDKNYIFRYAAEYLYVLEKTPNSWSYYYFPSLNTHILIKCIE